VQLRQLKLKLIEPIAQMPQLPKDLATQKPQFPNDRNAIIKRLQDRFHGKSLKYAQCRCRTRWTAVSHSGGYLAPQACFERKNVAIAKLGCAWGLTITPAYRVLPDLFLRNSYSEFEEASAVAA